MAPQATESSLPEVICRWLLRYRQLCTHTPEVVGALLGLLRQCPGAAAVMPIILEQVALSRRQRQALEAALASPAETTRNNSRLGRSPALAHGTFARNPVRHPSSSGSSP